MKVDLLNIDHGHKVHDPLSNLVASFDIPVLGTGVVTDYNPFAAVAGVDNTAKDYDTVVTCETGAALELDVVTLFNLGGEAGFEVVEHAWRDVSTFDGEDVERRVFAGVGDKGEFGGDVEETNFKVHIGADRFEGRHKGLGCLEGKRVQYLKSPPDHLRKMTRSKQGRWGR